MHFSRCLYVTSVLWKCVTCTFPLVLRVYDVSFLIIVLRASVCLSVCLSVSPSIYLSFSLCLSLSSFPSLSLPSFCHTAPTLHSSTSFYCSSDHNHQANYFVAMARAGYVCVATIHRTLTLTTGSLTCAQMLMHASAHGGVRTPKGSQHSKLTRVRKSLAAPGNRTCASGVTVWCSTNWATAHPQNFVG